jgi:phosphoribosylanthranilate isomerase
MLLKICGITREEDAQCAASAHADFIGAIIVPASKRQVSPEQAARIFAAAPNTHSVLVVRDMELETLLKVIDAIHPYAVQLHGNEPPEYASRITGTHVWKAFNLNTLEDLSLAASYPAEMVVADSGGGTGKPCDWTRAAQLAQMRPILLAGGLTPDNIQAAINAVHPVGIDLAGGVEATPGIKDHGKIKRVAALLNKASGVIL